MAFASLFASKGSKDAELDALFTRTKTEEQQRRPAFIPDTAILKATSSKITPPEEVIAAARKAAATASNRPAKTVKPDKNKNKKDKKDSTKPAVKARSKRTREDLSEDEEDAEDTTIEAALLEASEDSESENEDEESRPLIHEADLKQSRDGKSSSSRDKGKARQNSQTINETPAEKDARTIFVGNVPIKCATSKSSSKALVRHLLATLPQELQAVARLDTIRFRSIPLSAPAFDKDGTRQATTATITANGTQAETTVADKSENHAHKRARRWKQKEDNSTTKETQQKFLTAAQKRKVAYITGDVHSKAKSCTAYAVWTTKISPSSSGSGQKQFTPQQIATLVIKHANNTTFEDFVLRVDAVKSRSTAATSATANASEESAAASNAAAEESGPSKQQLAVERKKQMQEEKRTIYVGSLDFEETEQAVRDLCEKLMTEERGNPPTPAQSTSATESTSPFWVERVRIIKDNETGLGKGFAYVMFRDRECVDEMMALDAQRAKLSNRKLRLERCRSTAAKAAAAVKAARPPAVIAKSPSGKAGPSKDAASSGAFSRFKGASSTPVAPSAKVPENFGESLAELSKEERKALKASHEIRLQRRMEKKQGKKDAMKAERVKEAFDRKVKSSGHMSHKGPSNSGKPKDGRKKVRSRSDTAIAKKNTKKAAAQ